MTICNFLLYISAVSPCAISNPCLNGGSCSTSTWTKKKYRCLCPGYFTGDHCEKGKTSTPLKFNILYTKDNEESMLLNHIEKTQMWKDILFYLLNHLNSQGSLYTYCCHSNYSRRNRIETVLGQEPNQSYGERVHICVKQLAQGR